ncbi:MAG: 1-acyl-sn-glycerol-3-phosphate acyltransferase [Chloroflexi bacterium]|nr:1-acyl-sn-glycerol-3-phosphate acyltransferase [Chloroflexota bacterium]
MRSWFFHPTAGVIGTLARLLFRGRYEGVEHVPRDGAFILVANHCSNLDPALAAWATANRVGRVIHFMAKIEMRGWPILGWLATQSAVVFVRRGERDRAAQRQLLELLADGRPIGIFVEGTRSRDGRMKAVKPGAAWLALTAGVQLLPVGIAGSHGLFPGRARWPHATRITIRIGEPFTLAGGSSGRVDRQALAQGTARIAAEIAALLPPDQRPVT